MAGVGHMLNNQFIPSLHHPEYALGAGLAMLGGKSIIKILDAMFKAMK